MTDRFALDEHRRLFDRRRDAMNLFTHFRDKIEREMLPALVAEGKLPAGLATKGLAVEPPRDPKHGDISANAAMVMSKAANMKPRDVAELIAAKFRADPDVAKVEVAGPGFINLTLADRFWHERLREILRAGPAYGDCDLGDRRARSMSNMSRPTRPARCMSAMAAARWSAMRWRRCCERPAST